MTNRIITKMNEIQSNGHKSFSVVLMIGDPNPEATSQQVQIAVECGVDIVELGIPYINPYLDSIVMKNSMNRSLNWSDNPEDYLDYLKAIRENFPQTPFEVMVYYDTVMHIGLKHFAERLMEAQMDAVLVADYVDRDATFLNELDKSLDGSGVLPIRFVPHPFNPLQVQDLKDNGRGFIIAQTMTDDSGKRKHVLEKNKKKIDFLRESGIETPIVSAYGIKTPDDIRKCMALGADGVLLGTVILDAAHRLPSQDFRELLSSLRSAAA